MSCEHDYVERSVAADAHGYCVICMAAEIERLKLALYGDLDTADDRLSTADALRSENAELRAEVKLLHQQRDALLGALGNIREECPRNYQGFAGSRFNSILDIVCTALDAIKLAEGK